VRQDVDAFMATLRSQTFAADRLPYLHIANIQLQDFVEVGQYSRYMERMLRLLHLSTDGPTRNIHMTHDAITSVNTSAQSQEVEDLRRQIKELLTSNKSLTTANENLTEANEALNAANDGLDAANCSLKEGWIYEARTRGCSLLSTAL
jgi:hypothetical protein